MAVCSSTAAGVTPGLGFLHLTTAAAHIGSGGVRGAPKGIASASSEECCQDAVAIAYCYRPFCLHNFFSPIGEKTPIIQLIAKRPGNKSMGL